MKTNALSVANYFIELAERDNAKITPLRLMKLVYIAYGFGLALLDKSFLDSRFDKVEAWRFGPVIPSVYHSFKHFGKGPITRKTTMLVGNDTDYTVITPELEDEDVKNICRLVWKRYEHCDANTLVTILHGAGTPWGQTYEEGKNNPIPEQYTRAYYKSLVERMEKYLEAHA